MIHREAVVGASPSHVALRRWQHAAGPWWLYVGVAPFLSDLDVSATPASVGVRRSGRLPAALAVALSLIENAEHPLIVVDLPPCDLLRVAGALFDRGFLVVPVIHRWLASPAVLESRRFLARLIAASAWCRRTRRPRGIIVALDGERAGKPTRRPGLGHAFDNRYDYSAGRLPAPSFLRGQGITRVRWVSPAGIAPDLQSYAEALARAGFPLDRPEPTVTAPSAEWRSAESSVEAWNADEDEPGQMAAAQPPGLYRRFLQRSQCQGLLADHLVGGEPYLALSPLVLEQADDATLRELTATFAGLFDRAARQLAADVPALQELGFPWAAAELLGAETPRRPIVGRIDFVRDHPGHWWLLEYNADTPSGLREAIAAEAVACDLLPAAHDLARPSAGLAAAVVTAFSAALTDLPDGSALGILTDAGELEDLGQMVFTSRLIAGPLRARGITVIVGDRHNLRATRRGITLNGHSIGALYRYVPFETWYGTPEFAALYDAVAVGKIVLLNGLFGLLLQNKGLLSWLWSHRDDPIFSGPEQKAIVEHLPPTWNIASPPAVGDGATDDVVVKQIFGREGEEVFFGRLTSDQWSTLRHRRTYVVQRRIDVASDEAVIPTSHGARMATGNATVGSYAVDGSWAGYYTRFGGAITNARAKWLATLTWPEASPGDQTYTGG